MISIIILTFLFNLTYTQIQHIPPETILRDASKDSKTNELKTLSPSRLQSLPDNVSEEEVIKIQNNPFNGKDSHINGRQVGKGNEAIDQKQDKINNKEISANVKKTVKSNETQVVLPKINTNSQAIHNGSSNEHKNSEKSSTFTPVVLNSKADVMQSGALLRGFYVFLGLSVMIMVYFVFRSYRLRHGSQPSTTVRKYGVTARRSDMEMRPLELDDEDDDTLFEINNQNASR